MLASKPGVRQIHLDLKLLNYKAIFSNKPVSQIEENSNENVILVKIIMVLML